MANKNLTVCIWHVHYSAINDMHTSSTSLTLCNKTGNSDCSPEEKTHLACKRTIVDKMDVSSGAKSAISHLTVDRQYYLLVDYKHMIVNVHATENYTNSNILEQISKVESIFFGNQHDIDLFVRK